MSTRVEDFRLEDWLPYWISADDLIAALAALAMLVAFVAVYQALRGTTRSSAAMPWSRTAREPARGALDPRRGSG